MDLVDLSRVSQQITTEVYGFMLKQIEQAAVTSEAQTRLLMVECAMRILDGATVSQRYEVLAAPLLRK